MSTETTNFCSLCEISAKAIEYMKDDLHIVQAEAESLRGQLRECQENLRRCEDCLRDEVETWKVKFATKICPLCEKNAGEIGGLEWLLDALNVNLKGCQDEKAALEAKLASLLDDTIDDRDVGQVMMDTMKKAGTELSGLDFGDVKF